jgi:Na+/melibiose symporter-like transporter
LILVVVAMVPAWAHVLELPGKLRLTRDAYFAIQPIYSPEFTIASFSEPLAIISTLVLVAVTPRASADFWWTLAALFGVIGMHAVYWLFTHPVNNFWLQGESVSRQNDALPPHWTELRDRWEYSHVVRAGLAFVSFIALVIVIS